MVSRFATPLEPPQRTNPPAEKLLNFEIYRDWITFSSELVYQTNAQLPTKPLQNFLNGKWNEQQKATYNTFYHDLGAFALKENKKTAMAIFLTVFCELTGAKVFITSKDGQLCLTIQHPAGADNKLIDILNAGIATIEYAAEENWLNNLLTPGDANDTSVKKLRSYFLSYLENSLLSRVYSKKEEASAAQLLTLYYLQEWRDKRFKEEELKQRERTKKIEEEQNNKA
ncbi:MAG: hypothetical protein N3G80_03160 [Candidatus Micrarchaeota archaeon]|nr:hypothetical protein [Candidatus Micrarchaeota archaeon]